VFPRTAKSVPQDRPRCSPGPPKEFLRTARTVPQDGPKCSSGPPKVIPTPAQGVPQAPTPAQRCSSGPPKAVLAFTPGSPEVVRQWRAWDRFRLLCGHCGCRRSEAEPLPRTRRCPLWWHFPRKRVGETKWNPLYRVLKSFSTRGHPPCSASTLFHVCMVCAWISHGESDGKSMFPANNPCDSSMFPCENFVIHP
jgi:hypothetical protein